MEKQGQYTVVVIEDEPLLLKYIVKKIEKADPCFSVVNTASNGASGLGIIEEYLPDLVVSDIKMPQKDGIELAEHMANRFPQTLLVLLTGYADFEYAKKAVRAGVFEYMLKPLRSDELTDMLQRARMYLLAQQSQLSEPMGISSRQIFDVVREYLCAHYTQNIDLQALSEAFSYSPAYLTKLFRRYAGITPLRFLTDLRIQAAARLLRTTEMSVAEVGDRVGYPDPYYFSRVFKNSKGLSPQSYRSQRVEEA